MAADLRTTVGELHLLIRPRPPARRGRRPRGPESSGYAVGVDMHANASPALRHDWTDCARTLQKASRSPARPRFVAPMTTPSSAADDVGPKAGVASSQYAERSIAIPGAVHHVLHPLPAARPSPGLTRRWADRSVRRRSSPPSPSPRSRGHRRRRSASPACPARPIIGQPCTRENLDGVAQADSMKRTLLTCAWHSRAAPLESTAAGVETDFTQLATDYAAFQDAAQQYADSQAGDAQGRRSADGDPDDVAQYVQLQNDGMRPLGARPRPCRLDRRPTPRTSSRSPTRRQRTSTRSCDASRPTPASGAAGRRRMPRASAPSPIVAMVDRHPGHARHPGLDRRPRDRP